MPIYQTNPCSSQHCYQCFHDLPRFAASRPGAWTRDEDCNALCVLKPAKGLRQLIEGDTVNIWINIMVLYDSHD